MQFAEAAEFARIRPDHVMPVLVPPPVQPAGPQPAPDRVSAVAQPDVVRVCERAGFVECGAFGGYRPDPLSVFMEKRIEN